MKHTRGMHNYTQIYIQAAAAACTTPTPSVFTNVIYGFENKCESLVSICKPSSLSLLLSFVSFSSVICAHKRVYKIQEYTSRATQHNQTLQLVYSRTIPLRALEPVCQCTNERVYDTERQQKKNNNFSILFVWICAFRKRYTLTSSSSLCVLCVCVCTIHYIKRGKPSSKQSQPGWVVLAISTNHLFRCILTRVLGSVMMTYEWSVWTHFCITES